MTQHPSTDELLTLAKYNEPQDLYGLLGPTSAYTPPLRLQGLRLKGRVYEFDDSGQPTGYYWHKNEAMVWVRKPAVRTDLTEARPHGGLSKGVFMSLPSPGMVQFDLLLGYDDHEAFQISKKALLKALAGRKGSWGLTNWRVEGDNWVIRSNAGAEFFQATFDPQRLLRRLAGLENMAGHLGVSEPLLVGGYNFKM